MVNKHPNYIQKAGVIKMAYKLCKKVRELEPYEPIQGNYKIRLDANESFFNFPDDLKAEINDIIREIDFNRYPDPMALELTKAFADYYSISPENITVTNGSDEMLYLLSSALMKSGSNVVVVDPDFSMYSFYSFLSENNIFTYKKNKDHDINVDELLSFMFENNADMVIFSNPCNPTGRGISSDDARKLVNGAGDCLVVIDEAYMDFWNQSLLKEANEYQNLIVLKTASKAVGAAGIRLGFAIANPLITKALRSVKSPYNVNTLSQKIGACIYRKKDLLKERANEIIKNTKTLYIDILKVVDNYKLPFRVFITCANFVFVETDYAKNIYEMLLENGIAVRYFPKYSSLRITTGTVKENNEFVINFEKYIIKNILKRNR